MRFSIDKTLLEQVINYLATRPYNEVAQLISAIQKDIMVVAERTESDADD
jgi:hypothetical protein